MLVLCMMICSHAQKRFWLVKVPLFAVTDRYLAEQARRNPVVLSDGSPQALSVSSQTRLHDHRGAEWESASQASPIPPLCHSEARGLPAALRSAAGGGRRFQVLGRNEGAVSQSEGSPLGRRGRGSSARLRRL